MKIEGKNYRTIWPSSDTSADKPIVNIIDQTKLPHVFEITEISTLPQMLHAIKTMQVRGAPLIGAAAAYGMALAALHHDDLREAAKLLIHSRPTALNLRWAVERMRNVLLPLSPESRKSAAWLEAARICDEDVQMNHQIGQHGLNVIQQIAASRKANQAVVNILTHCNAGWLATVDGGTALAPIYAAHDAGLRVHVWVGETRPRNQGASLTAWELGQHGVPHTVVADNAIGHLMQIGAVDMVIVGADRVTALGDVCNKIGTYLRALAAKDNHIPFYAAVPSPTIDWSISDANLIEIEHRSSEEVSHMQGLSEAGHLQSVCILPAGSPAFNPAFDITPAQLVTGIMTEHGVYPPAELEPALQPKISL